MFIAMENQKIYNLIILDASGSMCRIYNQALSGVNETLATIRMAQEAHPELLQYVSLASFSAGDNFLNRIYSAVPVGEARDITPADYPLLGCTALYDAMGTCIGELQQKATHNDRVLVTVITDGSTYKVNGLEGFTRNIWVCPVTLFVLGEYPKYIYVKKI